MCWNGSATETSYFWFDPRQHASRANPTALDFRTPGSGHSASCQSGVSSCHRPRAPGPLTATPCRRHERQHAIRSAGRKCRRLCPDPRAEIATTSQIACGQRLVAGGLRADQINRTTYAGQISGRDKTIPRSLRRGAGALLQNDLLPGPRDLGCRTDTMHFVLRFSLIGKQPLSKAVRSLRGWRRLAPLRSLKASALGLWAMMAWRIVEHGHLRIALFLVLPLCRK